MGRYHATNLFELGRALDVWEALTARAGLAALAISWACRTAFSLGLLEREDEVIEQ